MNLIILALFLLLGACIGSFLNAAIYRLANKESIIKGRSHCIKCGKTLSWYDLLPIVSFLILKGKCRTCDKSISIQYILVEIVMALLFGIVAWGWIVVGDSSTLANLELVRDLYVMSILVFLFVFDLKYFLLPDIVTIPAVIIIFIINLILGISLVSMLIGLLIGAGFFALQFAVSKGRWIGGGDIRLGAIMGVLLGWPVIIAGLFSSYLIGGIVGMGLLISGRKKLGAHLPFGTFLAIGTIIGLWWGNGIINWYLSFL